MKKGFTLIELLIVIMIIGILSVAFIPTIMGAPVKARDARRLADLGSVANVIAARDMEGKAPTSSGTIVGLITQRATVTNPLFATDFPSGSLPVDPKTDNVSICELTTGQYCFALLYDNPNFRYALYARVEQKDSAGKYVNGNVACPTTATLMLPTMITPIPSSTDTNCQLVLVK